MSEAAYPNANISNNIYRDYQSRPIRQPKLRNSLAFEQELQRQQQRHQILDDRHLVQDYVATHDEYSMHASPGSRRRTTSYSNDPMRNSFREDNHRINIVVSSPQRYARSKRRFERSDLKSRQNEPPQYRPGTAVAGNVKHSVDPTAWINQRAPLVDYWQQSSPSSIYSQSGWSAFGGGSFMQDSLERSPIALSQRAMHMPPGASSAGSGNPGDKLTQRYQSDHRINSIRDPAAASSLINQHLTERVGGDPEVRLGSVKPEARENSGQYAISANNTSGSVGRQTFNQFEDSPAMADRCAGSNFENADSDPKDRSDAAGNSIATRSGLKGQDETVSSGKSACNQQQSSHMQTEVVSGSGCPLFSAR